MAVTRADKETELQALETAFKGSDSAILVDYKGLNVPQVTDLRRQLRGAKAKYKVVKNTLAKRALKGTRFETLEKFFAGTTAVAYTKVTGKPKRTETVQAGVAWLSADGGATWAPVSGTATGHGAQPQVAGVAAVGRGFVLLRPATVARRPAVDTFFSPNGLAWTFRATLSASAGFTALVANGGPDGAVLAGETGVTGQAGRKLTAFASADGQTWHQARPFGTAAAEDVSGVALAPGGAVVTAGRTVAETMFAEGKQAALHSAAGTLLQPRCGR